MIVFAKGAKSRGIRCDMNPPWDSICGYVNNGEADVCIAVFCMLSCIGSLAVYSYTCARSAYGKVIDHEAKAARGQEARAQAARDQAIQAQVAQALAQAARDQAAQEAIAAQEARAQGAHRNPPEFLLEVLEAAGNTVRIAGNVIEVTRDYPERALGRSVSEILGDISQAKDRWIAAAA